MVKANIVSCSKMGVGSPYKLYLSKVPCLGYHLELYRGRWYQSSLITVVKAFTYIHYTTLGQLGLI